MKRLVLTLAAAALAVAGCSSDSSDDASSHNDADVAFAQQMIPHHEQAVEMSDLALDDSRGASAEVQALATQIEKAQQPEIDTMTGWLDDWGVDDDSGHEGHDMSGMSGMMTEGDMTLLADSTGAEFDRLWLTMMVEHHEGAVEMAKTVLDDGSDPEVAALADDVVTTQNAEIAEMKALLDE